MGTSPAPTRRGSRGAPGFGRGSLPGEIKGHFAMIALSAAHELLEDASLSERVDQLPLRPGETVLSVGDSLTDDLQTWLETTRCVKKLLRRHRERKLEELNQRSNQSPRTDDS